jgi:hypothetical protein
MRARVQTWKPMHIVIDATVELVHDDDLMTGVLCHELDKLEWYTPSPAVCTKLKDPIPEWDRNFLFKSSPLPSGRVPVRVEGQVLLTESLDNQGEGKLCDCYCESFSFVRFPAKCYTR